MGLAIDDRRTSRPDPRLGEPKPAAARPAAQNETQPTATFVSTNDEVLVVRRGGKPATSGVTRDVEGRMRDLNRPLHAGDYASFRASVETLAPAAPLRAQEPSFEVVGADDPLSAAELNAQIDTWNADYAAGRTPTDPSHVYGTLYVTEEVYNDFGNQHFFNPANGQYIGRDGAIAALNLPATATTADILAGGYESDTFENYVQRHVDATNEMIDDGNERLAELTTQYGLDPAKYPPIGDFELRRVVVLENDPSGNENHSEPDDSYGVFTLRTDYAAWSGTAMANNDATQLHQGLARTDLDEGLIHEWGHRYFNLPDNYALNTVNEPITSDPELADVPKSLRAHSVEQNLMVGNTLHLSDYQLLRMSTDIREHGSIETPAEMYRYPERQLPDQFAVVLPEGVASIEVYQTTNNNHPNNYEQQIDGGPIVTVNNPPAGDFLIQQPFALGIDDDSGAPTAGDAEALIGIKLTMEDGSVQFRWLDATQVSTGALLGLETPRLTFPWDSATTDPTSPGYSDITYSDATRRRAKRVRHLRDDR
jgi:hypothetical protein